MCLLNCSYIIFVTKNIMEGRPTEVIYRDFATLRHIRTWWDYEDCFKDGYLLSAVWPQRGILIAVWMRHVKKLTRRLLTNAVSWPQRPPYRHIGWNKEYRTFYCTLMKGLKVSSSGRKGQTLFISSSFSIPLGLVSWDILKSPIL